MIERISRFKLLLSSWFVVWFHKLSDCWSLLWFKTSMLVLLLWSSIIFSSRLVPYFQVFVMFSELFTCYSPLHYPVFLKILHLKVIFLLIKQNAATIWHKFFTEPHSEYFSKVYTQHWVIHPRGRIFAIVSRSLSFADYYSPPNYFFCKTTDVFIFMQLIISFLQYFPL